MAKDIKPESLADVERRHIEKTLRAHGGNMSQTALALGIDRRTLYRKVHEYGWRRRPARSEWVKVAEA